MTPKIIDFNLWDDILGYKTGQENVKILFHPVEVPDSDKELFLHHEPESLYREAYEYVLGDFVSMGEFCYELYLATPYFAAIYKMWKQKQDFQWQLLFLALVGDSLSTDFPLNHYSRKLNNSLPKEIIENHLRSVKIIQKEAKAFVSDNFERLKQLSHTEIQYFCQCLLAILGDHEASYVLFMGSFNHCFTRCPYCTDPYNNYEDEFEFDWDLQHEKSKQELLKIIQPAPSVIGQWDKKSYDNDYLWLSNLLYLLGNDKDAEKLSYYYGTYTCPHCGKTCGNVMELAKNRLIQDTES